jgi:hypothetical protein
MNHNVLSFGGIGVIKKSPTAFRTIARKTAGIYAVVVV